MNSEQVKNEVKNQAKRIGSSTTSRIIRGITTNPIVVTALIILLIILILAGSFYAIKEKEFKDSSGASDKYVQNTKADVDNGITTTYVDEETGEELEYTDEKLKELFEEYGYDLEQYFSDEKGMENLKYILNSEVVTQFPYIEGLSSDKVNGVIKFKRMSTDGNNEEVDGGNGGNISQKEQYLKYTTIENLEYLIEEFNMDNSMSGAKDSALNHFAMDDEQNIIVAYLEEVRVSTNDEEKTIDDIKKNLDIKYQNIGYTTEIDPETGDTIYIFEILATEKIAYTNFIKDFTLPTEFLFGLLTYSEDLQFVLNIAKLAYESTIVIGIHDDVPSLDVKEYTYNRQIRYDDVPITQISSYYDLGDIFENNETFGVGKNTYYYTISRKFSNEDTYLDINGNEIKAYKRLDETTGEEVWQTLGANGQFVPANLKEYHINYHTQRNNPIINLYVADVWYGYYNSMYDTSYYQSQKLENTIYDPYELIPPSIDISASSSLDEILEADVMAILEPYLESSEYKQKYREIFQPSFDLETEMAFKQKFREEFEKANKDKYESAVELHQAYTKYFDENYESYKRQNYTSFSGEYYRDNYSDSFETSLNISIQMCKNSVSSSTRQDKYIHDGNFKEISYNINTSLDSANRSIATENNHFSVILANSANAYDTLESTGEWLIEQLENTEATVGIVDKVKHLLNSTYQTTEFGKIKAEDLGLFETSSTLVDIWSKEGFTEIAKACHDFLRLNNYYYSSAANKAAGNYVQDGTSTGGKVQIEYGAPQSQRYTDCSAYVTWVLMQTGHLPLDNTSQRNSYWLYDKGTTIRGISEEIFSSRADMIDFFENDVDTSNEGYILVKQGHTEIFAGIEDGYYCTYNAGSTSSIRKEKSRYTKEQFFNHFNWSEYKVLIVE